MISTCLHPFLWEHLTMGADQIRHVPTCTQGHNLSMSTICKIEPCIGTTLKMSLFLHLVLCPSTTKISTFLSHAFSSVYLYKNQPEQQ